MREDHSLNFPKTPINAADLIFDTGPAVGNEFLHDGVVDQFDAFHESVDPDDGFADHDYRGDRGGNENGDLYGLPRCIH